MKRHITITLVCGLCCVAAALVFGGSGSPERVQYDYRALIPVPIDPNALVGAVLPWDPTGDPNDPNTWTATAGTHTRTAAIWDRESLDYIDIKGMGGPVAVVGRVDPNTGTWTLEADLPPGTWLIPVAIVDRLPDAAWRVRAVTIVVIVDQPANTTPVVD